MVKLFPETASGQALRVATIFTAIVGLVLAAAAIGVNASATHLVTVDQSTRLVKGVHALAEGDLAAEKSSGIITAPLLTPAGAAPLAPGTLGSSDKLKHLVLPGTGSKTNDFGVRLIAWMVSSDGSTTAITPLTPELPPADAGVGSPSKVSIAGQDFLVAGAAGPAGHFVAAVSQDAVTTGSRTFATSALVLFPLALVPIFLVALLIGRASAAPIERNRKRQLEFAADASHELRTPLAVIQAETSLVLSRPRDGAEYQASLERIRGESEKMKHLVDNLLFLARSDSERSSAVNIVQDLGQVCGAVRLRFLAVAAARSIDLRLDMDGAGARVAAPAGWLERLVTVLVDNACRYTPEGGWVVVRAVSTAGQARLSVEDSGPGIPLEERKRVFERFHRGTSVGSGTGLGLAIADAIVRGTRGKWEVEQAETGGAALRATWPQAP